MIARRAIGLGVVLTALCALGAPPATATTPAATPALPPGYGCDGPAAPAPAGVRGIGGLESEALEAAVRAASRLELGRIAPQNRANAPFALGQDLAAGSGKPADALPIVVADCAMRIGLPLLRDGALAGRLRVGLCDRTLELKDSQLCGAKAMLGANARLLEVSPETRMVGLPPQVEQRDGLIVDYFPIVLRGRGLVLFYTAVATAPGSRYAVVVQVDGDRPCEDVPPAAGCAGLAAELTRLATELGTRYLLPPR